MRELTLRQVEVIRAVMLAGTIQGAATLLGVSAPGISRLVRHTEDSLGLRLFTRKGGLFVPAPEAARVFEMLHQVHQQMENLQSAIGSLKKGEDTRLSFASAPSIAQFIAARALRQIRQRFPDLFIDLNILKIEETADYLLMERGEFVVMSSAIENPALTHEPLVRLGVGGRLDGLAADAARARRLARPRRRHAGVPERQVEADDLHAGHRRCPFRVSRRRGMAARERAASARRSCSRARSCS